MLIRPVGVHGRQGGSGLMVPAMLPSSRLGKPANEHWSGQAWEQVASRSWRSPLTRTAPGWWLGVHCPAGELDELVSGDPRGSPVALTATLTLAAGAQIAARWNGMPAL